MLVAAANALRHREGDSRQDSWADVAGAHRPCRSWQRPPQSNASAAAAARARRNGAARLRAFPSMPGRSPSVATATSPGAPFRDLATGSAAHRMPRLRLPRSIDLRVDDRHHRDHRVYVPSCRPRLGRARAEHPGPIEVRPGVPASWLGACRDPSSASARASDRHWTPNCSRSCTKPCAAPGRRRPTTRSDGRAGARLVAIGSRYRPRRRRNRLPVQRDVTCWLPDGLTPSPESRRAGSRRRAGSAREAIGCRSTARSADQRTAGSIAIGDVLGSPLTGEYGRPGGASRRRAPGSRLLPPVRSATDPAN